MAVYNIAGLRVKMKCRPGGRIEKQAAAYLDENQNDENIDITIDVSDERIREFTEKNMPSTENEWEYVLTGADFYNALVNFDGMVLHSSCVVHDGFAYAFSAHSGTGKSTHTQLWLKHFNDTNTYILNDDKPALRILDDQIYAFGTPWSGKRNISVNTGVPLKSICFIDRAEQNSIKRIDIKKAIFNVLDQTTRQLDTAPMNKLFDFMDKIFEKVKMYEMGCNMTDEAVQVSYTRMSEDD